MREAVSLAPGGFGNVLILGEVLKVLGSDSGEDVHYRGNGRARVAREVVNDWIRTRPGAIEGDQAKHLARNRSHGRDVFNLLLSFEGCCLQQDALVFTLFRLYFIRHRAAR